MGVIGLSVALGLMLFLFLVGVVIHRRKFRRFSHRLRHWQNKLFNAEYRARFASPTTGTELREITSHLPTSSELPAHPQHPPPSAPPRPADLASPPPPPGQGATTRAQVHWSPPTPVAPLPPVKTSEASTAVLLDLTEGSVASTVFASPVAKEPPGEASSDLLDFSLSSEEEGESGSLSDG